MQLLKTYHKVVFIVFLVIGGLHYYYEADNYNMFVAGAGGLAWILINRVYSGI